MSSLYTATVPSNIAFIKYWGKRADAQQWPANDSLSMTLNQLATKTTVRLHQADDHMLRLGDRIYNRSDKNLGKTFVHLDRLALRFGYSQKLQITSSNSFPMGAGIASSASGLAALTLASLMAWTDSRNWDDLERHGFDRSMLADLARLGSGSACRSLFGGFVQWEAGLDPDAQRYASLFSDEHWALRDTVVLFSSEQKSVGSTEAHELAWSSPLFIPRLSGLPERMNLVKDALAARDMQALGLWLEVEALEMHAVIMTARQPVYYLNEAARQFLADLREARQKGEIHAYFTIDAGPNIHVIHEASEHERLKLWLQRRLAADHLLHDSVGAGPHLDFQSE
ncbi:MAG TPA: diphosphomevalonate decarboxylase [Oligoflexus sp.]|uniref:diphosphomevalonate decarboxylase n=1 Tax=Oligoflexus sp. TaxID=1971216 RepID=UPI002D2BA2A1|nr:diphosphomevalonate decarboxylase [Oligoflexus sp.]HYX35342.1 diphosphomevalonate decarboxylase [Oligoflexus sp.]